MIWPFKRKKKAIEDTCVACSKVIKKNDEGATDLTITVEGGTLVFPVCGACAPSIEADFRNALGEDSDG